MTRPSSNIDVLLFHKGEEFLLEVGFEQFSIRNLCKRTNVNLGMFHYYFKTKDHFLELLFEHIFDRYLNEHKLIIEKYNSATDKLRELLFQRALTARANKKFVIMFVKEAVNKTFDLLIKKHQKKEMQFIYPIIKQCQHEGSISKSLSMSYILPMITPTINFAVMFNLHDIKDIDEKGEAELFENSKFEEYINNLIDMIFRGLK